MNCLSWGADGLILLVSSSYVLRFSFFYSYPCPVSCLLTFFPASPSTWLLTGGGGPGGMGGAGGNNPFEMGKAKAKLEMEPNTGVKFVDVAGCDGSKLELTEVCICSRVSSGEAQFIIERSQTTIQLEEC